MPKAKKKEGRKTKKKRVVQVYNPKTKHWVKVNRTTGKIVSRKKTGGAYKGVPKGKPKKTVKSKTQKPKKRITHKLTYAPRKAIKTMVHSGNDKPLLLDIKRTKEQLRKEKAYSFKPDKKPDKTPKRIKDIGQPNLRTQQVQLKCKKLRDLPAIHSPDTAADILDDMSKNDREVMQVIYLNHRNRVIGIETAHKGTVSSSPLSPHEIYKTALLTNATGIIIAHNHPSGNPNPSEEDIRTSKAVKEGGKHLNIELVDSMVIGRGKYYSLKQEGML